MSFDKLVEQARELTGSERDDFLSLLSPEIRQQIEARLSPDPVPADDDDPRLAATNISGPDVNLGTTQLQPTTSDEQPKQIGPYKILQPIGRVRMGQVFMAEQTEIQCGNINWEQLVHEPF